jgi:hypothetical protein
MYVSGKGGLISTNPVEFEMTMFGWTAKVPSILSISEDSGPVEVWGLIRGAEEPHGFLTYQQCIEQEAPAMGPILRGVVRFGYVRRVICVRFARVLYHHFSTRYLFLDVPRHRHWIV